uniref:dolichol kinase n=1 Tax=Meloidogyne javanica TaxID=6303 RepID=A0A915LL92_MELJA
MNKDFNSLVYNDKALIGISWIATCSFVVMTLIRKRRFPCESSLIINIYLGLAVFAAYFLFACLVESDLKGTLLILLFRVFDGTYKSGLYNDPLFLALSGHLMLQIFIIIEIFRNQRIEPWSNFLDQMFLIFIDGQDSRDLILTPIFLLAGMFLPLFLDTTMLYSPHWTLKQRHFSGVLSVGVGDSFAAIVGSRFGRIPWPFGLGNKSRKTIEGSIAIPSLILSAMVSTIAEAQLNSGDNLIIPFCSAITFYLFE